VHFPLAKNSKKRESPGTKKSKIAITYKTTMKTPKIGRKEKAGKINAMGGGRSVRVRDERQRGCDTGWDCKRFAKSDDESCGNEGSIGLGFPNARELGEALLF